MAKTIALILTVLFFLTTYKIAFASSVVINEFMANPTSPANEWVEFYNPDHLDLSSYWIDDDTSFTDDAGSSTKKSLSAINNSNPTYPYIELTSAMLNNSGDYVVLFSNTGTIIDQYQYTSDPGKDKTIGRQPDGDSWIALTSSSEGSSNGAASPTPTPSPTNTPTPSPTASPTPTPSSSFTISNVPANINSDQSFTVNISLTLPSNPDANYYLKGAFKKVDGTRYFGLTKKDSNWIGYGEDYPQQYKISTDSSGTWSGTLEIKPDIYDSDYKGTGDYTFKIGRYTQGGSLTWSNEQSVRITDTQSPTPTPNPTTTSKIQPSPSSSVLGTDSDPVTPSDYSDQTSVSALNASLGISTSSATATSGAFENLSERKSSPNFFLIGSGVTIIIGAAAWHRFKNRVQL